MHSSGPQIQGCEGNHHPFLIIYASLLLGFNEVRHCQEVPVLCDSNPPILFNYEGLLLAKHKQQFNRECHLLMLYPLFLKLISYQLNLV